LTHSFDLLILLKFQTYLFPQNVALLHHDKYSKDFFINFVKEVCRSADLRLGVQGQKNRKLKSSKFAISFNLYVQVLGGSGKLRTIQLENVI